MTQRLRTLFVCIAVGALALGDSYASAAPVIGGNWVENTFELTM